MVILLWFPVNFTLNQSIDDMIPVPNCTIHGVVTSRFQVVAMDARVPFQRPLESEGPTATRWKKRCDVFVELEVPSGEPT